MDKFIVAISKHIINPLIILLFAIAILVFLWGLVSFMANADNAEAQETAKRHVMYGIFGIFIMISAFGIIYIVTKTFGIDTSKNLDTLNK